MVMEIFVIVLGCVMVAAFLFGLFWGINKATQYTPQGIQKDWWDKHLKTINNKKGIK
jgi:hypothetical protein